MWVRIKFICDKKNLLSILDAPVSAKTNIPSWFNKTPKYLNNTQSIDNNGDPTSTIRNCMPVTDSITAGYHICLPCDVWVETPLKFKWSSDDIKVVIPNDNRRNEYYPIPNEFYPMFFKWINQWIINTPKGYSCLLTHPMHQDLPFQSLPSIVDTDKHPTPINIPFMLRKDFTGLIPKGTPFVQVIPFKREKIVASFTYDKGYFRNTWAKAHAHFFDRYKRFFRSEKVFKCPFAE